MRMLATVGAVVACGTLLSACGTSVSAGTTPPEGSAVPSAVASTVPGTVRVTPFVEPGDDPSAPQRVVNVLAQLIADHPDDFSGLDATSRPGILRVGVVTAKGRQLIQKSDLPTDGSVQTFAVTRGYRSGHQILNDFMANHPDLVSRVVLSTYAADGTFDIEWAGHTVTPDVLDELAELPGQVVVETDAGGA